MSKGNANFVQMRMVVDTTGAYNNTDGVEILRGSSIGASLPDAKLSFTYWYRFVCPPNFAGGLTIEASVYSVWDGDIYCKTEWQAGGDGEDPAVHFGSSGYAAVTLVADQRAIISSVAATTVMAGDVVMAAFYRDATNVADTLGHAMNVCSIVFTWYEYS